MICVKSLKPWHFHICPLSSVHWILKSFDTRNVSKYHIYFWTFESIYWYLLLLARGIAWTYTHIQCTYSVSPMDLTSNHPSIYSVITQCPSNVQTLLFRLTEMYGFLWLLYYMSSGQIESYIILDDPGMSHIICNNSTWSGINLFLDTSPNLYHFPYFFGGTPRNHKLLYNVT